MKISRRQLIHSVALTGGYKTVVEAAEPAITVDVLRNVSVAHGSDLNDDRLRIIEPVLKSRRARVQALRDFEVDDSIGPTQGILE